MNYFFLTTIFIQEAIKQIILGFIQGLTEFLPISSTAHLIIIPELLGWGDPGLTSIASIQLGSLIAVLIYFWKDLKDLIKGIFIFISTRNYNSIKSKLSLSILIGNLPIIFIGLYIKLFWPSFENSILREPIFIGIISIIMAIILFLAEKLGKRIRNINNINIKDGLLVGLSQVLAIIPGVSRSGITISSSLLLGLERGSSAKFSFLLGIPAIFLSGVVETQKAFTQFSSFNILLLLIGIISASITSFLSIDLFMKFLRRYTTKLFVLYRLAFGFFVLLLTYKNII